MSLDNTRMGSWAQLRCRRRTDNHVKRVSCRDLMTPLRLAVMILTLGLSCHECHAAAGDISCQGIRYTYFEQGLDTTHIPAAPQQGESRMRNSQSFPVTDPVSVMTYYAGSRLESHRHFVIVSLIILKDVSWRKVFCAPTNSVGRFCVGWQ